MKRQEKKLPPEEEKIEPKFEDEEEYEEQEEGLFSIDPNQKIDFMSYTASVLEVEANQDKIE